MKAKLLRRIRKRYLITRDTYLGYQIEVLYPFVPFSICTAISCLTFMSKRQAREYLIRTKRAYPMKVYRIKHKPSGLYVCNSYKEFTNRNGQVYFKKCFNFDKYASDPDYEILYDEIKD